MNLQNLNFRPYKKELIQLNDIYYDTFKLNYCKNFSNVYIAYFDSDINSIKQNLIKFLENTSDFFYILINNKLYSTTNKHSIILVKIKNEFKTFFKKSEPIITMLDSKTILYNFIAKHKLYFRKDSIMLLSKNPLTDELGNFNLRAINILELQNIHYILDFKNQISNSEKINLFNMLYPQFYNKFFNKLTILYNHKELWLTLPNIEEVFVFHFNKYNYNSIEEFFDDITENNENYSTIVALLKSIKKLSKIIENFDSEKLKQIFKFYFLNYDEFNTFLNL